MTLSTAELAQMRRDLALLYPDTCNILSVAYTSDGAGGMVEAWGTATASVPCRVDYISGKEVINSGALLPYQSAVVSMAYDATITPSNRIEVGTNTFTVQAVNNGQSWQAVTRCRVELIP